MSFPYINAFQQFFDSSGDPLISGTIEFRSPTTNSLINSYPTADDADAQTNANDNPLTLNAYGAAATGLFLEDGVKYKVIVKDVNGATVKSDDNVLCPIALPYLQTAAESAAGVTPTNVEYPPGDVKRYGATGDGSTDDTAAFQAAIDANDEVYVPDGTYIVANLQYKSNFRIRGESHAAILKLIDDATTASYNGGIVDSNGVYPANILASTLNDRGGANYDNGLRAKDETNSTYIFENVTVENLTLDGNKANNQVGDTGLNASAMGAGVSIHQCNNVTVRNCIIKNCRMEGVHIGYTLHGGSDYCTIENCHFTGNQRLNVAMITGKYNSIINNTGTLPTGGTGVSTGNTALDIEANYADEVNYRHTIVGNRLGGGLGLASVAVANMKGTVSSGNYWAGPLTLSGGDVTSGVVIDGDAFSTTAADLQWINRSGENVADTDITPTIIKNCTVIGFERVFKTLTAGQMANINLSGCTFNGETFGSMTRPYKVSITDCDFYFSGMPTSPDAFTLQCSNTLGATVTQQGQVVIDGNRFYGVSHATSFRFVRDTSWTLDWDDFIFSNNKVYLTGATNSFETSGSVSIIGNTITAFKPITMSDLGMDKFRLLRNMITSAAAENLFADQSTLFDNADISRNELYNISINIIRPQDVRVLNNSINDGTLTITYSFTSTGIGRNSVCFNSFADSGALTVPFTVGTGASFLVGDFVDNDQYQHNTYTGYSSQPSIAAGVVTAVNGSGPIKGYAATNVSEDRAFDADTVAVAELADVVGTIISDLGID